MRPFHPFRTLRRPLRLFRPLRPRGPRRPAALLLFAAAALFPVTAPAAATPAPVSVSVSAAAVPVPGTLQPYAIGAVHSSGISSGGYMATQLHVAYSGTFSGSAVFASGPYHCARNMLATALNACMNTTQDPQLAQLEQITRDWSAQGLVDPVANLMRRPRVRLQRLGRHDREAAGGRRAGRLLRPVRRAGPVRPEQRGRPRVDQPAGPQLLHGHAESVDQQLRHRRRARPARSPAGLRRTAQRVPGRDADPVRPERLRARRLGRGPVTGRQGLRLRARVVSPAGPPAP